MPLNGTPRYLALSSASGMQSSDDSSTLLSVTSFPGEESRMITVEFITALFYEVDEDLR